MGIPRKSILWSKIRRTIFAAAALPVIFFTNRIALAALSESEKRTVDAVEVLRQATFSHAQSGRGVADLIESKTLLSHEPMKNEGTVSFVFSGHNSIHWFTAAGSTKLTESGSVVNDRLTRYLLGGPGIGPTGVSIARNELSHQGMLQEDSAGSGWSYEGLGRLPWNLLDHPEAEGMNRFIAMKPTVLKRMGSQIELSNITVKKSGDVETTQSMLVVFDLDFGGMLRKSDRTYHVVGPKANDLLVERQEDFEWRSKGSVLPAIHEVRVRQVQNGKTELEGFSKATFKDFRIEPVKASEFDIGSLGIPPGTIVVDSIAKMNYRYNVNTGATTGGMPLNGGNPLDALVALHASERKAAQGTRYLPISLSFLAVAGALLGLGILIKKRRSA